MEPEVRFIPRIIGFLGYVPFDCPADTLGKLAWFKKVNGLSCERLGVLMGRDPEQLEAWLSGRIQPFRKNLEKIEEFLRSSLDGRCQLRLKAG
jgi:hypothetical protein